MNARSLSAAVLAGGESRRMGSDKAMLDFGGRPLVRRIADELATISDDVFVVAKQELVVGVPTVIEAPEPQTPLLGVLTALRAARHPLVFVCGCDMPFVSTALATLLTERASGVDVVVPFREGKSEALHAVWSTAAADKVAALLERGEFGLRRAIAQLHADEIDEAVWRSIDPEGRCFANLNTPDDLRSWAPTAPPPSSSPRPGS